MAGTHSAATEESERNGNRYWFPKTLVRFFILLPDPLPTWDRYTNIRTAPLEPLTAKEMEEDDSNVEVRGRRWLDDLVEQTSWSPFIEVEPHGTAQRPDGGSSTGRPPMHFGFHQFHSVTRLWNGSYGDSSVIERMTPIVNTRASLAEVVAKSASLSRTHPRETPSAQTTHDYTVAEVVVPRFDGRNPDPGRGIDWALDVAVECVRHLQSALYLARIPRLPLRVVTRKIIDPDVVYEIGKVNPANVTSHDFPVDDWTSSTIEANIGSVFRTRPPLLTPAENDAYDQALRIRLTAAPMHEYLELRRRAQVALDRDADYESSVIWAAATAEYLLDEVLRLMLWERGKRPEECLQQFKPMAVTARVMQSFSAIAGSTWDLKTPGPILEWRDKVASLRNDVVHEIRRIYYPEALRALETVDALHSHIGNLLIAKFEKYWRTSMLVVAPEGLRRRGKLEQYEQLRSAVFEPDWGLTFQNWRQAHRLLIRDKWHPRAPVEQGSMLVFVWGRKNRGYWVLHHRPTHLAVRVDIDETGLTEHQMANCLEVLDGPQDINDWRAIAERVIGLEVVKLHTPWVEEHNLMPLQSAMVDGSDIRDELFAWRPRISPIPPPS